MEHFRRPSMREGGWLFDGEYDETALLSPMDSPLTAMELDGGWRTPHNCGQRADTFISLKRLLTGF